MFELNILFFLVLLILSFYFLLKSSDYLIESSTVIGKRIGISPFVIGVSIIAIGTSLPELFTSIFGILDSSNSSAFVLGTVVGSNIANILLVFGVLLYFSKSFEVNIKKFDMIFFSISTLMLYFLIINGVLSLVFSILFLTLFIFYMYVIIKNSRKKQVKEQICQDFEEAYNNPLKKQKTFFLVLIFILSLIILNLSAKGVVYSIENLGIILSIPLEFLTFTSIAFATSLPELIVTYQSAKKKEYDLAIGNIIGSNISNVFLILGVSGLIKKIEFLSSVYIISVYVLVFASILFLLITNYKDIRKYSKHFGIFIFLIYVSYILFIFF